MRFWLLDSISQMEAGRRIVALRDIDPGEDYFQDHFPGFPVVPGVILTEMMAQAAAKCFDAERHPRGKAVLAKIRNASFRDWVRPGDRVELHAEVKTNRADAASAECRAEVAGKEVASADLLFSFVLLDRLSPDFRDPLLEAYFAAQGRGGRG